MITIRELKTLIILSGNKRLPDLESDIISDHELSTLYLDHILETLLYGQRVPVFEKLIFADFELTKQYLAAVIDVKYPRHNDMTVFACPITCYAIYVMKEKWTEAEHIILKDAYYSYRYAAEFGRWDKAEAVILQVNDAYIAYMYARDVIKGRWIAAEPLIRLHSDYYHAYLNQMQHGENNVDN